MVNGIPAGVVASEKELFEGFLEQFKKNQSELQLPLRDNLALAGQAGPDLAIAAGHQVHLEYEEMKRLRADGGPLGLIGGLVALGAGGRHGHGIYGHAQRKRGTH